MKIIKTTQRAKKVKVKPRLKVAAQVTFNRPGDMDLQGRKRIATWLRRTATDLVKLGDQYSGNFRGRYYYAD